MNKTIELIGRYEGERFRFDNPSGSVVVGSIRLVNGSKELASQHGADVSDHTISIKGEAERDDLIERGTYRFLGTFSNYQNKRTGKNEKQFHFRTFVEHVPHEPEGVAQYLANAGRGNGIGPAKARRLVDSLGVDEVLDVCRNQPGEVARITGIELEAAEAFSNLLKDRQSTENATLELDTLLAGRGFPRSLVRRVIREWGNSAAQVIIEDPYKLIQFHGVGFRLADKLYMELGKDPASIDRQALSLWSSINGDMNGHSWHLATDLIDRLGGMIGEHVDPIAAIKRGREFATIDPGHYGAIATIRSEANGNKLVDAVPTETATGKTLLWIADGKTADQESQLAKRIIEANEPGREQLIRYFDQEQQVCEIDSKMLRCARCNRALTSDVVHVVDGLPYGPTCFERML